jgi:uncharacterized protein YukJ
MPIRNYGVLKGRIVECRQERDDFAPHYQILIRADGVSYRASINVQSGDRRRPDLLFDVEEDVRHPLMQRLAALDDGFHPGEYGPDGLCVDYLRSGLVRPERMQAFPHHAPGADNDLNEKLDALIRHAIDDPDVEICVFGGRWGPERERDQVFRFSPGNGIHDVHMNQGTPRHDRHAHDNGVWQDGAIFLHLRDERRWVGIFLAFQGQSWRTDDRTGDADGGHRRHDDHRHHDGRPAHANSRRTPDPARTQPHLPPRRVKMGEGVRIAAAEINPQGDDRGLETVTLHNTGAAPVTVDGWVLDNGEEARHRLAGEIAPDARLEVRLPVEVPLSNRGGTILLLDAAGRPVDGVTYTRDHARDEGRTIRF